MEDGIEILEGRRIVELVYLAEQLWCNKCNLPLSLRYVNDELRSGLASTLTVKCVKCGIDYRISTNKVLTDSAHTFSVNLKLAMGMYLSLFN